MSKIFIENHFYYYSFSNSQLCQSLSKFDKGKVLARVAASPAESGEEEDEEESTLL